MTLWAIYDDLPFYAVRNAEGQYSLWPQSLGLPAGWEVAAGPAPKARCLAEVEGRWTDMRPASVRSGSAPAGPAPAVAPIEPGPGTSALAGPAAPAPPAPVHLLIEQAACPPGAIAVRCGDVTLTRGELSSVSRAWAAVLTREGCGPETLVALLIPRSADAIAAILAVLRAGAAYVPLPYADPGERLAAILADCGNPLVVADDALADQLAWYQGRVLRLSEFRARTARTGAAPPAPAPAPLPGNLAFVIYTSGTMGEPKGVEGTHGQLTNYALWCREAFAHRPGEWTILHAPLTFLGSLTTIFTPLLAGWPIEIAPEGSTIDDLLQLAARVPAGLLKLTPTHVRMMLARGAAGRRVARQFMIGSEPLVVSAEFARWMRATPDAVFANHYGLTETHGCFCHWFGAEAPVGEGVPIGTPIANVRAHILGEDGSHVPAGEMGELVVAGESIGRGYHAKPALTAQRWIPDRYGPPGSRALRTGDLARLRPDGTVEVIGRADRQVKVRGHRVEPAAVEHALRSLPGVAEALVLPTRQDGAIALAAYLAPQPGAVLDTWEIHHALSSLLPPPSVPSRMAVLAQFPVNSNGKVDVSALPEAKPITRGAGGETGGRWTRYDLMVADAFCAALGVDAVGLDDDFFDLGGDSMMAVGIAVALGERLGRDDIPVPAADCGSVRAYSRVIGQVAPQDGAGAR